MRKGADMAATSDKDRAQSAVDDAFEIAVQGLFRVLDRELRDNPAQAAARFEAGLVHLKEVRDKATASVGKVLS
jgi:hypothetical protein